MGFKDMMGGFAEKAGGFAGKAGEKMKQAASEAADKSKLLAEKAKIKSKISTENSNVTKAYTELGKKYFEISGLNPSEEYIDAVDKIKESMARISELQQQLAALEIENTCPKCGTTLKKDQQFCQACGTKLENFVDVPYTEVVEEVEKAVDDQQ